MPPHVLLSNTMLNFSVKKGKNREFESFPIEVLIQEEKCEWNLNFAISANGKFVKFEFHWL